MRRIAIICEYGTLNGGEQSLLAVLDQLAGRAEFVVLAPARGRLIDELARREIAHRPLDCRDESGRRLPPNAAADRLVSELVRTSPDIVHANSLSMSRLLGRIADRLSLPCTGHLRDILRLSRAALNDLSRNHLLIAVSEATRRYHVEAGLDPGRVRVVPNGVDCVRFRPRPATGRLRRELGLGPSLPLVAAIGQIGIRKGHDVLVESAIQLAKRLPDVHYLIVGQRYSSKAESIEYEQRLHGRLRAAGLVHRFHWLGFRDDVHRLLNEVDLLVHPARQEPLGRVLLEAAASGVPIVATGVGGTPEILRDGESALLVPPGDRRALSEAIERLLRDGRLRERCAAAARQAALTKFDITARAGEIERLWANASAAC